MPIPPASEMPKYQHDFTLGIMLQRQHEEIDLIDVVVDIGLVPF